MSTYNGDMIGPAEAWEHFTQTLNLDSAGVVAVTVAECGALQLPVRPNPLPAFTAHTFIDFNGLSRKMRERKADSLKQAANNRGWQFRPQETP